MSPPLDEIPPLFSTSLTAGSVGAGKLRWRVSETIATLREVVLMHKDLAPVVPEQLCERQKCTSTVSDSKGGVTVFSGPDEYREVVVTNYRPNGEVVFVQGSTEQEPAQLAAVAEDRAYTFTR